MRHRTETIFRIILIIFLIMSIMAIGGPFALGVGMMLISLIFCDSGPFQRCAEVGAVFLGVSWFCAVLPVPVVIALVRNKKQLGWYMYVYPVLMLALAYVAYALGAIAFGMTKIVFEYAFLGSVAFAYVVLRRIGSRETLAAGESPALPPAR